MRSCLNFVRFIISLGLADVDSSQRSTWRSVIECLVVGSRISISSEVAGPMFSIHGSALNVRVARIAAS